MRDHYDMDYNWDFSNDKFTLEDQKPPARNRPGQEIPTHRWTTTSSTSSRSARAKVRLHVSRAGNLLVGGWELTGIYTAQSGMFLTVLDGMILQAYFTIPPRPPPLPSGRIS